MELRLISLFGWMTMILAAWAISYNRKLFPWRTVVWGIGLQFVLAVLILKTPWGTLLFEFAGKIVQKLIQFSGDGCRFVFGPLADEKLLGQAFGSDNNVVFAVLVMGTIIIVASISSLLYHWGILQRVVHAIAWVMRKAMRTSGSETLSACANIFMGQTEAPLMIRPYVPRMTQSEIMTIMVCGMAHIAGGVAAIYAAMGMQHGYQDMAGHLLTASVLNCPAALMIAKILLPETQQSETAASMPATVPRTTANSIDAICRGASDGFHLALNVIAMLIAFIAMISLANYVFTYPQRHLGLANPATLQTVFGWVNAPFAWLMGVPRHDTIAVGQILGERIVLNEFVGYLDLTTHAKQLALDPRSFTIATYALCGFANFSSIAIQVGGIGSLAPERRGEMAKVGFRAMLGGLLAAYMTACLAGVLL
ncbi:MAG TPA: nucleoside transporter C-terminal domain-containing protein [Candidatus Acidoferrales bacterium]|jgi:CNT family concentrative nucleoside transporter|nr:nucleoside transporter C-terminal domain-containing protein [Candidatus Acidoferrales bacterium]